ncbi:MAG: YggT family protein [Acidimicrobiia bacterium]
MSLVCWLLGLYSLVFFVRMLMSWVPITPGTGMEQVHNALVAVTEPLLRPVRRVVPPARVGMMALDLSPIIVVIGIYLVRITIC